MLFWTSFVADFAAVMFSEFAAQDIIAGTPFDERLKSATLCRVISSLVSMKLIAPPPEKAHDGWVEVTDVASSFWFRPHDYEELVEILSSEIVSAELLATPTFPVEESPPAPPLSDLELFNRWAERTGGTRKSLASEIGVSVTTVGRMIRGECSNKYKMKRFRDAMK